ncbi:MAG: hypothetical protein KKE62_05435 [Proteobacteria bacterium]|nr:hypothetical protein [Pseudomonadota bacterium]MBU1387050.1 hypothetical protein [Pseudomonadota bacterium]MBU1542269.1 hypothetical protein [Pseudomonadota bacterium]MBU2430846.1 hypothetical protein [Pseudomonadota bacterium]MBU2481510.1 hypothetical protein [Pseudomonadota bacterium]
MLDQYQPALNALERAEKMGDSSPLTIGTLAVCHDKLGQANQAIAYYHKYLSMNSSDRRMNQMAHQRLDVLEK